MGLFNRQKRNVNRAARFYLPCVLLICVVCLGCGKKDWAGVPPEEIPSLAKDEFSIREGMSRTDVELILGFPAEVGRTKEGHALAQYNYGARVRTVIYDYNDSVVTAYPY